MMALTAPDPALHGLARLLRTLYGREAAYLAVEGHYTPAARRPFTPQGFKVLLADGETALAPLHAAVTARLPSTPGEQGPELLTRTFRVPLDTEETYLEAVTFLPDLTDEVAGLLLTHLPDLAAGLVELTRVQGWEVFALPPDPARTGEGLTSALCAHLEGYSVLAGLEDLQREISQGVLGVLLQRLTPEEFGQLRRGPRHAP